MPEKFKQQTDGSVLFNLNEEFILENGHHLPRLTLVYETWGELNSDNSNVILVHHALSVGSHASSHDQNTDDGWWENIIGPGKAIDTLKYYVICINNLGSCFGSSGPTSLNPDNNKPYNAEFPQITMGDMAASQKLLLDHLEIEHLHAIVGSSMGAMISLTWAIEYPASLSVLIIISTSYKSYPANIANRDIQHQAIRMDPMWQNGNYESNEQLSGFKLARKLGLYTYRHSSEWNRRFNSHDNTDIDDTDIIQYMNYNADKFCRHFDANCYLILTQAMDLYDVTLNYASIRECFSKIKARTLVVSVESDILCTPQQQEELFTALQEGGADCHYINHHSQYGHDAFLVETEPFTKYITEFL
jgi:homoserine O-acetyltransferase